MVRRAGQSDYPAIIRTEACNRVWYRLPETTRIAFLKAGKSGQRALLQRGSKGDPVLSDAYADFQRHDFGDAALNKRARAIERPAYRKLVVRWLPICRSAPYYCESKRNRSAGLTQAQKREAAIILGTPQRSNGKTHYWRSVTEALALHPQRVRLKELHGMSRQTAERWGKQLCKDCKDLLGHGPVDRRDELPAETLQGRQECAAVWAGDRPWLTVEGRKLVRAFDPDVDDCSIHVSSKHYVWWGDIGWDAYRYFTFMLDASSINNQKSAAKTPINGFISKQVAYPPEDTRPAKSVAASCSVFFYVVLHAQLGLVCGPDIMHFGSSPTARGNKKGKKRGRHDSRFTTWCVHEIRRASCCSITASGLKASAVQAFQDGARLPRGAQACRAGGWLHSARHRRSHRALFQL